MIKAYLSLTVFEVKLTRLSSRLDTVEANLCSPANSDIKNKYSGADTWLDLWVRPGKSTSIVYLTTTGASIST